MLENEADEEASAESVLSRVAEDELEGDHDKRLVFENDSESSSAPPPIIVPWKVLLRETSTPW